MKLEFETIDEVREFVGHLRDNKLTKPRVPQLPLEEVQQLLTRILDQDKIAAIKLVRAAAGCGLKDAYRMITETWPFPRENDR